MELGFVSDWVNDRYKYGKTPLIQACGNLDSDLAKGLINLGADIKKQDEYGSTPLIETIINGLGTEKQKLGMVKLLIDAMDKEDIKQPNYYNQTALHVAASLNYLDIVKALIDIDPQDPDLLKEDDYNNDFVDVLEKLGSREWLRENYPVIDSRKEWKDNSKRLNDYILPEQPLNFAFINAYYAGGQTLLIQVCQKAELAQVQKLIKEGADVNKLDKNGNTALLATVTSPFIMDPFNLENRLLEIVKVLIEADKKSKTDANQKVHRYWITLLEAAKAGYLKIIKTLIDADCNELFTDAINGIDFYVAIIPKYENWLIENYKNLAEELKVKYEAAKFGI